MKMFQRLNFLKCEQQWEIRIVCNENTRFRLSYVRGISKIFSFHKFSSFAVLFISNVIKKKKRRDDVKKEEEANK